MTMEITTEQAQETLFADPVRLRDQIACERASRSLRAYYRYTWPQVDPNPIAEGFYIDALAEHLEAVLQKQIRHLMVSIRPKMGKSTLGVVLFPTYIWKRKRKPGTFYGPQTRIFATSYSDSLCERDAANARQLLESPWSQARWPLVMRNDQNQKGMYYNVYGGYRRSVPIRGQITGAGGDIVIVDDPISFVQSMSEAERDKVAELLDGAVMQQRVDFNESPTVWFAQRLHVDDPFGRILEDASKAKGVDYLCLQTLRRMHQVPPTYRWFDHGLGIEIEREIPAPGITCTALTRSGKWQDPRAEGECIAPSRLGPDELARLQANVELWAAQDMQDPLPPTEGRYFQGFNPETSLCDAAEVVSLNPEDGWEFWLGGDHGDGRGKEAIPLLCVHRGIKKIVITDAYVSSGSTTPAQDAVGVRNMLKRNALTTGRISLFVADVNKSFKADGTAINVQLSECLDGIQITTPDKSSGSVATGELLMNLAFRNAYLFVDKDLEVAITAFSKYSQKSEAFKDFIDACRYALYELLRSWIFGEGTSELY